MCEATYYRLQLSAKKFPQGSRTQSGHFQKKNGNPPVYLSGPQRGQRKGATSKNIKNHQKVSKIFSRLFDIFRAGQKNVKRRRKVSKMFSTFFDNFRAAPVFRPLLGPPRFICSHVLTLFRLCVCFECANVCFFFFFERSALKPSS